MKSSLTIPAGLLAGLALDTARRTHQAQSLHPPLGRHLDLDTARIHYLDEGSGRPVVLIHGAGMQVEDMALALFPLLTGRYRAIAIDRPGYGYSGRTLTSATPIAQARMLRAALRQLGVERPILVGHSHGGLVALAYALEFQDELDGLVLLAPYGYTDMRVGLMPTILPAVPLLGPLLAHTVLHPVSRLLLPVFLDRVFAPNPVPDYVKRGLPGALMLRPRQAEATARDLALFAPTAKLLSRHYPEIRLPTAIVVGKADRMLAPERHAEKLYRSIRGSTLDLLPGVGHMVHHVAPDRVLEALHDVIRRTEAAGRTVPAG